jgi:hypothetical protein
VLGDVDRFLERRGGAVGARVCVGCLGSWTLSSIRCATEQTKTIRRCARTRGVGRDQEGAAESPEGAGIVDGSRQGLRIPVTKFIGFARCLVLEKKGGERGSRGIL